MKRLERPVRPLEHERAAGRANGGDEGAWARAARR
jgi:hypothetical protein